MKYFLSFFLILIKCISASLPEGITTEARFSYFIPSSKTLSDIYDSGGVDYELMGNIPIWKGITAWWAGDYFYKEGRSLGSNDRTRIQIGAATLGAKYMHSLAKFTPYGGLGMKYFFLKINNHGEYVNHSIWKNGLGGVVEIGTLYTIIQHFVLDIYVSYSYKEFSPPHNSNVNVKTKSLNIGGWNLGGGLGYQF